MTPTVGGTRFDETVAALWAAGEAHDRHAMIALLAPDVIVRSPITQLIRFEGIDQARDLFIRIFDIISDIKMYEVVGAGTDTQVIFWRGNVRDTYLEEANLLKMNDAGQIAEMTVFMRAVPGLLALLAGIAPSLASRHGRFRAAALRIQLGGLQRVYQRVEPVVLAVARAGVPVRKNL
jgi:SnoaL-like domain